MASRRVNGSNRAPWLGWILGLAAVVALGLLTIEIFDTETDVELEEPQTTEEAAPESDPDAVGIGETLANHQEYVDKDFPSTDVRVAAAQSVGGFWIAEGNDSLFAAIIQVADGESLQVRPGQRIHIDGGTLRDSLFVLGGSGLALDSTAQQIAESQPIFLAVDPRSISFPDERGGAM